MRRYRVFAFCNIVEIALFNIARFDKTIAYVVDIIAVIDIC